jgi:hypothetical protein
MNRKIWYTIIGCVALVAVGITAINIHSSKQAEKEQTLISELRQLRSAVTLYTVSFKENPPSLAAALDAKYPFTTPAWTVKRDAAGNLVDPFGGVYSYDKTSGWVSATTSGYEKW